MLTKVVKSRYIYEFDLKGFFDSVPVRPVVRFLEKHGLSYRMANFILLLSQKPPQLPADRKLDETAAMAKEFFYTVPGKPPRRPVVDPGYYWGELLGFPQGANISPFLSIISLIIKGNPTFARILMYADDGLFYSNKRFTPQDVEDFFGELGLTVQPTKSGWIRENYKWVKPLKFLGLVYQPLTDEL